MLIYEYRVRDEFLRLREYAANVRDKFQRETPLQYEPRQVCK